VRHALRLVTAGGPAGAAGAILLACSGSRLRNQLMASLLRRGFHVTACQDGREAVALLQAGRFDLLLTSLVMPNMDGLELIRDLRLFAAPPPAIAFAEEGDRINELYLRCALAFGAACVHTMPLESPFFFASIYTVMDGKAGSLGVVL
jgi:CheY-like chemotaxis protein